MMSLSDDKQADIIDTFNTTSRYLDEILNIHNIYYILTIWQVKYTLNKVNNSDTEALFLDLHLSTSNDIGPAKLHD